MKKNAELYAGALKKKYNVFFCLISIQGNLSRQIHLEVK